MFRDDAAAYCAFIDKLRAGPVEKPYTNLLRLLSNLVKSGFDIPFDMPEGEYEKNVRVAHEQTKVAFREIAMFTAPACEVLAADSRFEESRERAAILWTDLAEMYFDLREGLDLYALGGPNDIAEAVYVWRWGYEQHWGDHLLRALMTVHEINRQLYFE